MNESFDKSLETIFLNGNYCINMCFKKRDLREYKFCFNSCQSFLSKKWEYVDNYLVQIENIIDGRDGKVNSQAEYKQEGTSINRSSLKNKYVLDDYYYQSSPLHDVGVPNQKQK